MIRPVDIVRKFTWLAALPLLAACSSESIEFPSAKPALWQVAGAGGETEGWLFGTIHELPEGVDWRTDTLNSALAQSDWLMVEVGNLDETSKISAIFSELAISSGQPQLKDRVGPAYQEKLSALMAKGNFSHGDFESVETWAAALTLANVFSEGETRYGVDQVLISEFAARLELEGARAQLGIFDGLAEEDQRDLLEGILRESQPPENSEPFRLAKAWIKGDVDELLEEDTDTILSDPELRTALLTDRNTAWIPKITNEMDTKGPIMIAVGAAHMIGDEGLPALLSAEGYVVTRIQ